MAGAGTATILSAFLKLSRSQWQDRAKLRRLQDRKLRSLVRHAYETVPFYKEWFDRAAVRPQAIRTVEDLPMLPVLSKSDMQAAGALSLTSTAFPSTSLTSALTSGSTGRPLTIRYDRPWRSVQRALFLRALWATGYRPGDRVVILTDHLEDRSTPPWMRWSYLPYSQPPGALLQALDRIRPAILYGWVTPLRRLALHARRHGLLAHRPKALVTTAESLDGATRQLLHETFGSEPFEFYGLSESGTAAWECHCHDGLHFSEDTLIPEFPDLAEGAAASRLIVTNLDLYAMPFLRYDTGDVVVLKPSGGCACGRLTRRVERIEGRSVDCVQSTAGRVVLPYELTCAVEHIMGLERYKIVQTQRDAFAFHYEGPSEGAEERAATVRAAIAKVVGDDARVAVDRVDNLDPPTGRKFRIVESRLDRQRDTAGLSEGTVAVSRGPGGAQPAGDGL
jgi:phenylacetate-CoA ligase